MEELSGRVAVVTGGGGCIGLALGRRFGAAGMAVVLADVDEAALASGTAELEELGVETLAVEVDVRREAEVDRLAAQAIDRFGAVHVVCNNAGVAPLGGVTEMSTDEYRWVLDVNLFGVLHGIKAFLPILEAQGEGHIVNTSSVSGLLTQPGASAYNMSKFGVIALSEALFYELELRNSPVGVSVACPATVPSGIFDADRLRPSGIDRPEGPLATRAGEVMAALTDAARRTADDVAAAIVDAVVARDFYVLTHRGILPFVRQRNEDIEMQRNPSVEQGF